MFDAIVIGSGMSGGIVAKELCERGLKTLVLERGRKIVGNGGMGRVIGHGRVLGVRHFWIAAI